MLSLTTNTVEFTMPKLALILNVINLIVWNFPPHEWWKALHVVCINYKRKNYKHVFYTASMLNDQFNV